jgi:hypothetical protein
VLPIAGSDAIDGLHLFFIVFRCGGSFLHCSNHNSFRCFVVLLDDFQVQGSSVDSLEVGVGTFLSTGDLRILPDLSTFYGRKVGKFMAVNRPIYGNLFTGSRYKKKT